MKSVRRDIGIKRVGQIFLSSFEAIKYTGNNKIPGLLVRTANEPNIPANQYFFRSKYLSDRRIQSINKVSGLPIVRTAHIRGQTNKNKIAINRAWGIFLAFNISKNTIDEARVAIILTRSIDLSGFNNGNHEINLIENGYRGK